MKCSSENGVSITEQMYKNIQPFIFMSRLLGLAPVAFEKNGNKYFLSISYKYIAYSYALGLALAGSALFALVTDINAPAAESLRVNDTKAAFVVSFDIGLMIFIVILGIFISPFKIGKYFRILESLKHVHNNMTLHDQEQTRKMFLLVSSVSFTIFLAVLIFDFIGWYVRTKGLPSSVHLWKNIAIYSLYIVSFTQEICYWQMSVLVKRCFITFNDCLRGNRKEEDIKLIETQSLDLSNYRTRRQLGENNSFRRNIKESINNEKNIMKNTFIILVVDLTADKVEKLIHVYRTLFKIVNLMNEWYEIPLLFILLSCLLQLIGTPYFILTNTKTKILIFSILEIVWLFAHVCRLLIIIEASHRCIKEYEKINHLLCSHLDKNYDGDTMHQLKILALHVSACRMKFSTYGIADLNRSILASITGAVTTYLVVLVQLNTDSVSDMTRLQPKIKVVRVNSSE